MTGIELQIDPPPESSPASVRLSEPVLVVAGFTGRDVDAVRRHLDELKAHGVEEPESVPTLYPLPAWLLRSAPATLEVSSRTSSGEAEPVLIRLRGGDLYVTVGSDHTDRELERSSIALSKLVCPKVVAPSVWRFEDVADRWDELRLRGRHGGDPYQDERLASIVPPLELLERVEGRLRLPAERPLVLFMGTIPLLSGELRFGGNFSATLADERHGRVLECRYSVEQLAAEEREAS